MMKRKELLHIIIPLFLKSGYKLLTMDEIASNLSMSKKTIYKFFSTKNDLISSVNDGMVEFVDGILKRSEVNANNGIELMFIVREEFEKVMNLEEQAQFFKQYEKLDKKTGDRMLGMAKNVFVYLATYTLKKVEVDGYLNPNVDIPTVASFFSSNYLNLILYKEYESNEEYRHIMRQWYYAHLRGPINNEGNIIMDEYIKNHPELMQ